MHGAQEPAPQNKAHCVAATKAITTASEINNNNPSFGRTVDVMQERLQHKGNGDAMAIGRTAVMIAVIDYTLIARRVPAAMFIMAAAVVG